MPQYRVIMGRTRTITEHCAVSVNAFNQIFAERDAKAALFPNWNGDQELKSKVTILNVREYPWGSKPFVRPAWPDQHGGRLQDGAPLPDNCANMGDGTIREYFNEHKGACNVYRMEE